MLGKSCQRRNPDLVLNQDPDHESIAQATNANRHGFEVYDHLEGQAKVAEQNAHAADDGVIDKKEKKQMEKSHKKALESRHRGYVGLQSKAEFRLTCLRLEKCNCQLSVLWSG